MHIKPLALSLALGEAAWWLRMSPSLFSTVCALTARYSRAGLILPGGHNIDLDVAQVLRRIISGLINFKG